MYAIVLPSKTQTPLIIKGTSINLKKAVAKRKQAAKPLAV
jgi:hypothetical protein